MRFLSFIGAVLCIVIAVALTTIDYGWIVSAGLVVLAPFLAHWSFKKRKLPAKVVLSLGGVSWKEEDFCRGWEIDGRTGSGKTASAVVPIIHQLKENRPDVGILALDTKGDLSEPLARIMMSSAAGLVKWTSEPWSRALALFDNDSRSVPSVSKVFTTSRDREAEPNTSAGFSRLLESGIRGVRVSFEIPVQ